MADPLQVVAATVRDKVAVGQFVRVLGDAGRVLRVAGRGRVVRLSEVERVCCED
jgi:hypothetical protein